MKNLTQIISKTILITAFLSCSLNSLKAMEQQEVVIVQQLISLQQKNAPDCGFFAAWNAHCMVTGEKIDLIQGKMLDAKEFDQKLKEFKQNSKNATDINSHTMETCVFPFIQNNRITIIDNPQQLQKDVGIIPESLLHGIANFKKNGTPHAVLYNTGAHWIAFGIIKEQNQTIICQACSAGKGDTSVDFTPTENYIAEEGSPESILFKIFNDENNLVVQEPPLNQSCTQTTTSDSETDDIERLDQLQKQIQQNIQKLNAILHPKEDHPEEDDASLALALQLQEEETRLHQLQEDEELARRMLAEDQRSQIQPALDLSERPFRRPPIPNLRGRGERGRGERGRGGRGRVPRR
jgi:hypothetical protein